MLSHLPSPSPYPLPPTSYLPPTSHLLSYTPYLPSPILYLSCDAGGVSSLDHHLHDGVFDILVLGLVPSTLSEVVADHLKLR